MRTRYSSYYATSRKVAGSSYNEVDFFFQFTQSFAIKENMETLIDASKEFGLEVNTEKTKYMLLSRHRAKSRHKNR
jgi:hypothetical protein